MADSAWSWGKRTLARHPNQSFLLFIVTLSSLFTIHRNPRHPPGLHSIHQRPLTVSSPPLLSSLSTLSLHHSHLQAGKHRPNGSNAHVPTLARLCALPRLHANKHPHPHVHAHTCSHQAPRHAIMPACACRCMHICMHGWARACVRMHACMYLRMAVLMLPVRARTHKHACPCSHLHALLHQPPACLFVQVRPHSHRTWLVCARALTGAHAGMHACTDVC